MEIIPAILTNDPGELKEKIAVFTKSNREWVRRVQIDIVDGVYADNKTVGVEALGDVDSDLLFDVQLMVEEPVRWVEKCVGAGADRVIGHVEKMSNQAEFIAKVTADGLGVGLGLDIGTPITLVKESLRDLDVVLLMSVPAGFGGQEFDEGVLQKVEELNTLRREGNCRFMICVDGGVNESNIALLGEVGVDEVAIGKGLWGNGATEDNLGKLVSLVG